MYDHSNNAGDLTYRMCEVCKYKKPKEFGRYVSFNNRLNQKWHCKQCYEKRNKR